MSRRRRRQIWILIAAIGICIMAIFLLRSTPANRAASLPAATTVKPSFTSTPLRASTLIPAHARAARSTSTLELPTPSPTPAPTLTEPEEIPDYFYIYDFTGHEQWFSIGCEASAAVDWANYFGVSINEREFQTLLPVSDNPDLGFVGDVNGAWGLTPPDDYGVHAAPVAELLRWYGLDAMAQKGLSLDDLEASIAQSRPVIAWVVGNVTYGTPLEYVDKEGNITTVAAYEHVVIVTGYNFESVRYMNNGTSYDVSTKLFLESWGVLGNMAVMMGEGAGEN